MQTLTADAPSGALRTESHSAYGNTAAREAFTILRLGFVVAPIVAGLDKFTHLLVDWNQYLSPFANKLVGGNGDIFMYAVGVIEIIAGIGIALRPRLFGYVIFGWLWGIIINLLMIPGYFDVVLRDVGLSLAALALAKLSPRD